MTTAKLEAPATETPTWEIARLFPMQGHWTEAEYLELDAMFDNRMIELTDGYLEILPMPKTSHQLILRFILKALEAFVEPRGLGLVLFAPLRVRLRADKFREPDIIFMSAAHRDRAGEDYWEGADLVMEIVSPGRDNRERDIEKKPDDYAKAGIAEYWIIDPERQKITVLRLEGTQYAVHGEWGFGAQAASALLAGFSIDVQATLEAK
jgi:Uma2 family endonuclease